MGSVRFELRVEESVLGAWAAEAAARDLSLSEFVRVAVGEELGRGLVAAGPPVVEAERPAIPWSVTDHENAKAKVVELREAVRTVTGKELFAPVAPPASPVQARVVPWKREVKPDPKSK